VCVCLLNTAAGRCCFQALAARESGEPTSPAAASPTAAPAPSSHAHKGRCAMSAACCPQLHALVCAVQGSLPLPSSCVSLRFLAIPCTHPPPTLALRCRRQGWWSCGCSGEQACWLWQPKLQALKRPWDHSRCGWPVRGCCPCVPRCCYRYVCVRVCARAQGNSEAGKGVLVRRPCPRPGPWCGACSFGCVMFMCRGVDHQGRLAWCTRQCPFGSGSRCVCSCCCSRSAPLCVRLHGCGEGVGGGDVSSCFSLHIMRFHFRFGDVVCFEAGGARGGARGGRAVGDKGASSPGEEKVVMRTARVAPPSEAPKVVEVRVGVVGVLLVGWWVVGCCLLLGCWVY
jgi:hypothetical protein